MKFTEEIYRKHVKLYNNISENLYTYLNEKELSESEKFEPEIAHLLVVTIVRIAAKLAKKIGMNYDVFIYDCGEMFMLEHETYNNDKINLDPDLN